MQGVKQWGVVAPTVTWEECGRPHCGVWGSVGLGLLKRNMLESLKTDSRAVPPDSDYRAGARLKDLHFNKFPRNGGLQATPRPALDWTAWGRCQQ